ncbi:PREDICTED: protein RETICULATA-RELATED 1, chloroplastic-like isoform X2 [Ipomoea nil]|uniref:protein RETICULATA-RELATED 1, chloroplastic-like isoform X2 n=1 Tax=Ipomoea nil TaxID=35883 RepID=UPI0009012033|nr:PREDICTED: protein RETICULATA-RELATED 1, chloroplastic-like isoform X2 [Ipomoea nil]
MSHTVFQTAQLMPIYTSTIPTSKVVSSPKQLLHPAGALHRLPLPQAVAGKMRKSCIRASSSSVVDGDAVSALERCFQASPPADCPSSTSSPGSPVMFAPVMKGGKYGSLGAVTLEKSKLDMTQKQTKSSPELSTGGGGGDIGKSIFHGGGDGGDDGDDDDYMDDFDDDDEGDEGGLFRRRMILQELFDRKFVDAVLNEWQKTMMDLPAGLRQAYEMGLVSSAQMVKFLAINARPTTARFISRSIPQGLSRGFIGRMIADPAFLYKFLLEQAATIGCSVLLEVKNRKERIKQEWDLALVNVLTVTACNAIVLWSLAPCRSYGNTFRFDLQNTLQKLPNNIFEKSYPLREFDMQKRFQSFFYKAAELCMVGLTMGAAQGGISNFLASKKEGRLSVSIPSVSNNALGYGAFLGLYANLRYQLLCGFDQTMMNYFDVIGVALCFSTALRVMNVHVGETSRLAWLGVEPDPLAHADDLLKAAYNRPSEGIDQTSSKWFISKNAIVSGLGLLGIKQGQGGSVTEGEAVPPKARRKRVVRKKATANRTA